MKERLEEIKKRVLTDKVYYKYIDSKGRWGKTYTLSDEDYKYLMQQAERVQELEDAVESYKKTSRHANISHKMAEEQNKRYREVLEFYADRNNYKLEHFDPNLDDYMSTVDYDEGQKARRTIGSEKIND